MGHVGPLILVAAPHRITPTEYSIYPKHTFGYSHMKLGDGWRCTLLSNSSFCVPYILQNLNMQIFYRDKVKCGYDTY